MHEIRAFDRFLGFFLVAMSHGCRSVSRNEHQERLGKSNLVPDSCTACTGSTIDSGLLEQLILSLWQGDAFKTSQFKHVTLDKCRRDGISLLPC